MLRSKILKVGPFLNRLRKDKLIMKIAITLFLAAFSPITPSRDVAIVQSFQMIPLIALIVISKHAPDVQRVSMPTEMRIK